MIWGVRNLGTAQLDTSVVLPVMTWGCFVSPFVTGCFTTLLVTLGQILAVQAHRNPVNKHGLSSRRIGLNKSKGRHFKRQEVEVAILDIFR